MIKRLFTWILNGAVLLGAVLLTIMLIRGFDSRRLPDLKLWHTVTLSKEFCADDLRPGFTFNDYLQMEEELFLELDEKIESKIDIADRQPLNRYFKESISHPSRQKRDWNRSFEFRPKNPTGGILLLHGLTDGPYSLRSIADIFTREGLYVLAPRLPGHGTTPGSLKGTTRKDWIAAAKLAMTHVRAVIGDDKPFYMGGYSNGGLIAVKLSLDAIDDPELEQPDKLFLFSPAIGVSRFGAVANWHKLLTFFPYFKKLEWSSIYPEYDPFKYNSFPKIVGHETFQLTEITSRTIVALKKKGKLKKLPPMIAFSSVVDSTVLTSSLIDHLFNKLPPGKSRVVLFDVNRSNALKEFIKHKSERFLEKMRKSDSLPYAFTLVTNVNSDSQEVVARSKRATSRFGPDERLGLSWPENVYSLSHVAIPIPPSDLLYGDKRDLIKEGHLSLGLAEPRGERDVLRVPVGQFMRLRYNPFFGYMERCIVKFLHRPSQIPPTLSG